MTFLLPKVVFFNVAKASDKLKKIFQTAEMHFVKKEPLLVLVSDGTSALFIDEWLWKMEESSFLPHEIADRPSDELIVIATSNELHQRHFLFNLCPEPPSMMDKVKIFYEFDDSSSCAKQELSKKKFAFYKEKGFSIEAR